MGFKSWYALMWSMAFNLSCLLLPFSWTELVNLPVYSGQHKQVAGAPCSAQPHPRTQPYVLLIVFFLFLSFWAALVSLSLPIFLSPTPGGWRSWCVGIHKDLGPSKDLLKTNLSGTWRHREMQHKSSKVQFLPPNFTRFYRFYYSGLGVPFSGLFLTWKNQCFNCCLHSNDWNSTDVSCNQRCANKPPSASWLYSSMSSAEQCFYVVVWGISPMRKNGKSEHVFAYISKLLLCPTHLHFAKLICGKWLAQNLRESLHNSPGTPYCTGGNKPRYEDMKGWWWHVTCWGCSDAQCMSEGELMWILLQLLDWYNQIHPLPISLRGARHVHASMQVLPVLQGL